MERYETWFTQDMDEPIKVRYLEGNVFSLDNYGNRIGVHVLKGGEPLTVTGNISGTVIRSDGATVGIVGDSSENRAWLDIPQAAFAVPGVVSIILKATEGSRITTLYALVANVYQTSTDSAVDPGTIIPSVTALINLIETTVATIPSDYTATVNGLRASYGLKQDYSVNYDYANKILYFPGGFFTYYDDNNPVSAQTLNISSVLSAEACNLYINSSGVISAGAWNGRIQSGTEKIGYVFERIVVINGVPPEYIKVYNGTTGSYISGSIYDGAFGSLGAIGASHTDNIVYNYTTKVLTIPPAFTIYRGYGYARGSTVTLNLSSILHSEACTIYISQSGSIYAADWNYCHANNQRDQAIGYIYKKNVVLFGVNPNQISVIDESVDKVFCFGDSITAGVNATNLYHVRWHEMNPNAMFYNWGVGSTGYVLEYTGNVMVGGGVVGRGTTQAVSGNNNVLKIMQSVTGAMPNICIFSGTNDYGNNIQLETFRTAVQNTLDYALTKTAKILVITPIKREGWEDVENGLGLLLKDYSDVIKEECEARGIMCADGYNVGLDPSIQSVKTAFVTDGLHPNNNGHARIARCFNSLMQEAFCR